MTEPIEPIEDEPEGLAPGPKAPATGAVLRPQPWFRVVRAPSIDARSACAEALIGYLRCAVFHVWGGEDADRTFQIERFNREWPDPEIALQTPTVTVLDSSGSSMDASSLTPHELEETADVYGANTVLWKTAELVATFQVDFWLGNEPEREAVAAALPAWFAPGEDQYGVIVQGPPTFFDRPVRLTLLSTQRMDTEGSIYPNERRLMAMVRAEVDEVHLRCATLASVRVAVPEVGETVEVETESDSD